MQKKTLQELPGKSVNNITQLASQLMKGPAWILCQNSGFIKTWDSGLCKQSQSPFQCVVSCGSCLPPQRLQLWTLCAAGIFSREHGSNKKLAAQSCACSLVRQLYHLGVIEPYSGQTKKKGESVSLEEGSEIFNSLWVNNNFGSLDQQLFLVWLVIWIRSITLCLCEWSSKQVLQHIKWNRVCNKCFFQYQFFRSLKISVYAPYNSWLLGFFLWHAKTFVVFGHKFGNVFLQNSTQILKNGL